MEMPEEAGQLLGKGFVVGKKSRAISWLFPLNILRPFKASLFRQLRLRTTKRSLTCYKIRQQ